MESDTATLDPIAVVRRFGAAWDRLNIDEVQPWLTADIRYCIGPLAPLVGIVAVKRYLHRAGAFQACRWQFLAVAANGPVVLTQRIDHLVIDGRPIVLPVMGRFDVADGFIRAWCDYFDLASYRAQWPAVTGDDA